MTKRKHTETSTFGVSSRQNHSSRRYYDRALGHAEIDPSDDVNELALRSIRSHIFHQSSEDMQPLPDNSVALMVTSPSYHVGKDYDTDATLKEYLALLERVFTETHRVLEPGGRAAINVANLGRKPYVRLVDLVAEIMGDLGFHARGEIIWVKGKGASGNMAVGSYLKPTNPCLRDLHEYILVYSKGRFDRAVRPAERARRGLPHEATITKDDFFASTLSIWEMRAESAKRVGHPAPFPLELPRRLIELYTFKDDVVLDPFMGSGTTAVAALTTQRRYVGFDLDEKYVELANHRVAAAQVEMEREVVA